MFLAMSAAALAATISPRPAPAAEPAHFAVMGVRLYMSAQEVLTALYAQGVREDGVNERVHPCARHAASACTEAIMARLPDGPITIRFTDAPPGFNDGREAAFSVAYQPNGGASRADAVRSVAEERFGPLSDAGDGAWCAKVASGACPEDGPRMTFRRSRAGVAELALTDLGLASRLSAGAAPIQVGANRGTSR
ncbi:MAG TPA: hypothetical protein VIK30_01090 [Polyangia bacterium]